MTDTRLTMRIQRLRRRAARLERGLELSKRWDERNYRLLRPFILEILDEDPDATDEEIVEALVEKADELTRFSGIREIVTDIGLRLAARLGLWVHGNRVPLIKGRIKRLRKRIEQLEKQGAKKPRGARDVSFEAPAAAPDDRAIMRELGMDEQFMDEPAKAKPRPARTQKAAPA